MPAELTDGDTAPEFTLADDRGVERTLSEFLSNGPVVLFFYPAAMSPGCTIESCHFRDLAAEFAELSAQRIGISADSVDKQHEFANKHSFDYPLLSDPDGEVARQFGVRRKFGPLQTKRKTFVIDTDRTILRVISNELRMNVHPNQALEILRARKSAT